MSRIFQKTELLEESTKTSVATGEVEKLEQKLGSWSGKAENKLVAYLGSFGSGKSSTLDKVESNTADKYYWLNFEIWRYPDRQQIWDGFVIEVVNKLENDKKGALSPRLLIKRLIGVGDRIEGAAPVKLLARRRQRIMSSGWFVLGIFGGWLVVSWFTWLKIHDATSTSTRFWEALIKYSAPLLFVVFAFLGVTSLLPKIGRPLRRLFELEGALYDTLTKNMDKPLIITIEDVDRCKGDEGLVFLETLRHFLKEIWKPVDGKDKGKPVIVIAPQQYSSLNILEGTDTHSYERSIKIYDLPLFFGRSALNPDDVGDFLNSLEIVEEYRGVLRATVIELTNGYGGQTSMRKLKFILREVDDFCDANPAADPSIAFILIFAQNTVIERNGGLQPYRGSEYLDGRHNIHNHPNNDGYEWHVFADMLYNASGEGKYESVSSVRIQYPNLEGEIEIWRQNKASPDQITIALDEKYRELVERS